MWVITREEFVNGFALAGCANIEQMKKKIQMWKEQAFSRADTYKQFYSFCFDYLRQEKKILCALSDLFFSFFALGLC